MKHLYARFVLFLIRPALLLRVTPTKRDESFVDDAMRDAATEPRFVRRAEKG